MDATTFRRLFSGAKAKAEVEAKLKAKLKAEAKLKAKAKAEAEKLAFLRQNGNPERIKAWIKATKKEIANKIKEAKKGRGDEEILVCLYRGSEFDLSENLKSGDKVSIEVVMGFFKSLGYEVSYHLEKGGWTEGGKYREYLVYLRLIP